VYGGIWVFVDRPVVSLGSTERHVALNQSLILECHVTARPPARLSWKHNAGDVIGGRVNVVIGASVVFI